MSNLVVDASAIVDVLTEQSKKAAVENALLGSRLHAPSLLFSESLSSLRRLCQSGEINTQLFARSLTNLESISIKTHSDRTLLRSAADYLENTSAYDAIYVALAKALGVPLVTTDARLARAPVDVEVVLAS